MKSVDELLRLVKRKIAHDGLTNSFIDQELGLPIGTTHHLLNCQHKRMEDVFRIIDYVGGEVHIMVKKDEGRNENA